METEFVIAMVPIIWFEFVYYHSNTLELFCMWFFFNKQKWNLLTQLGRDLLYSAKNTHANGTRNMVGDCIIFSKLIKVKVNGNPIDILRLPFIRCFSLSFLSHHQSFPN